MNTCPLCKNHVTATLRQGSFLTLVECDTCGTYECDDWLGDGARVNWLVSDGRIIDTEELQKIPMHIVSGITRRTWEQGNRAKLLDYNLRDVLQSQSIPSGPIDQMDHLLWYLSQKGLFAGQRVPLSDKDHPVAFVSSREEFEFLVHSLIDQHHIDGHRPYSPGESSYLLTAEGWQRVRELRRTQRDSNQAFVAMWFDPGLELVYKEGFEPALDETGYRPVRIDLVEHNQKIDDRIVAEIRRSGLLVADFTGNRGGVYFEAGFAFGLGIPVIWTCSEKDIDNVHFDTRQYNHIVWANAADLKTRLIDRIEATLPDRTKRIAH